MNKTLVVSLAVVALGCSTSAFAQFFDNFDSYAAGSQMHGQGGWKGWANSPGAGALVSNTQAFSGTNSIDINGASDLVHEFSGATSGLWTYSERIFVPTTFTGTSYSILMSNYNDAGTGLHWSVQLKYDGTANTVGDDSVNGGTVTPQALVKGQWSLVTVLIDLTNNTRQTMYNGNQVSNGTWTDGTGGTLNVGAVDLFANNSTSVFRDNVSLQPVPEPVSMVGLSLGCLALIRRRRAK